MADGYRERGRDRGRDYDRRDQSTSIFSDDSDDDDRGRRREGGGGDRGFIDRAGDELRSWFGDDDAERRRERDARRGEGRAPMSNRARGERGRFEGREPWGGGDHDRQADYGSRGGYGQGGGGYAGSRSFGGSRAGYGEDRDFGERGYGGYEAARGDVGRGSGWDENYRRWRDQQIEQLDREYDEYCRHRQQRFEQDFHSWRENRGGERSTSRNATGATGSETAGATTAGGGTAPATKSSTGTSGDKETGASAGTSGKGRARKSS